MPCILRMACSLYVKGNFQQLLMSNFYMVWFMVLNATYNSMPTGFFIWGYMYPFTFIFGGTSKFLEVQHLRVQRKCLNCIFSTQGRAPCCFLSILLVLTVTVLPIGQLKNKEPIELGDLSIISSHLKYARNALIG